MVEICVGTRQPEQIENFPKRSSPKEDNAPTSGALLCSSVSKPYNQGKEHPQCSYTKYIFMNVCGRVDIFHAIA